MSVPVALEELARRVEEFGSHPFLITAGEDRRAHVVSATAQFDGGRFSLPAGRTSRANVASCESATLLWPGAGGPYALIVDGIGQLDGDDDYLTIVPSRAVLHRLAGASEDLPSCVPIESTG